MTSNEVSWKRVVALASAALVTLLASSAAEAAVAFKAENGWQLSFDGFVNAFGVNQIGSNAPEGVTGVALLQPDDVDSFRVRTGLLPGLFAFNVSAPTVEGLDVKARVGLYPQVNNSNTRNAFGSQIDLREIFFTVDSKYGQLLVGRALNLYQGKNILTDMSLFGVGAQGAVSAGGTTLGRIGFGYLYSQFGAQLRYTTPSLGGVKIAVAAVDPSVLGGTTRSLDADGVVVSAPVQATETKLPGFEAEVSYAQKFGETSVQSWVSGLQQNAWQVTAGGDDRKQAIGGAAGVGVGYAGFDVLASGFAGKGLGSALMLDTDSLDPSGAERTSYGFLVQGAYTYKRTKLGLSYGQNTMQETSGEKALRTSASDPLAIAQLESRRSVTAGVYHDVTSNLKLVAEYSRATADWFGGQDQTVNAVALGGFFIW